MSLLFLGENSISKVVTISWAQPQIFVEGDWAYMARLEGHTPGGKSSLPKNVVCVRLLVGHFGHFDCNNKLENVVTFSPGRFLLVYQLIPGDIIQIREILTYQFWPGDLVQIRETPGHSGRVGMYVLRYKLVRFYIRKGFR